jgi:hypothetical protein
MREVITHVMAVRAEDAIPKLRDANSLQHFFGRLNLCLLSQRNPAGVHQYLLDL